jgi:hypothetical protein
MSALRKALRKLLKDRLRLSPDTSRKEGEHVLDGHP